MRRYTLIKGMPKTETLNTWIPGLDLLRCTAVFLVLIGHAKLFLPGESREFFKLFFPMPAAWGVELFFFVEWISDRATLGGDESQRRSICVEKSKALRAQSLITDNAYLLAITVSFINNWCDQPWPTSKPTCILKQFYTHQLDI